MMEKARRVVKEELATLLPELAKYKKALNGKKAAIYVGGAFKALYVANVAYAAYIVGSALLGGQKFTSLN